MQDTAGFDRETGSQSPHGAALSATGVQHPAAGSASAPRPINASRLAALEKRTVAPVLLNAKQAAAFVGVSERRFAELRHTKWFPAAIELGPRALRWYRDELIAAAVTMAPRRAVLPEPAQLRTAREREIAA